MDAAATLRDVRARSGLSLRALARRAATSHSALAAYEAGRVTPTVETFARVVRAAGFRLTATPDRAPAPDAARSRELLEVLQLAARFPARHDPDTSVPIFRAS